MGNYERIAIYLKQAAQRIPANGSEYMRRELLVRAAVAHYKSS